MQENSESITTIQDDTNSAVSDLNDEIAGKQESYDNVAEGMADLQGKTDYVKEFDEATEKATLWEGINQTATAAGGTLAAAKGVKSALASTAVWWVAAIKFAAAATGAAGATMCGFNAAKQFEYRGIAQNEIDTRHAAEEANAKINDIYESDLEAYALSIDTVEDLELEIPEDMEAPEDVEIPEDPEVPDDTEAEDDNPSAPGFGLPDSNQDDDKKDKEPKK